MYHIFNQVMRFWYLVQKLRWNLSRACNDIIAVRILLFLQNAFLFFFFFGLYIQNAFYKSYQLFKFENRDGNRNFCYHRDSLPWLPRRFKLPYLMLGQGDSRILLIWISSCGPGVESSMVFFTWSTWSYPGYHQIDYHQHINGHLSKSLTSL